MKPPSKSLSAPIATTAAGIVGFAMSDSVFYYGGRASMLPYLLLFWGGLLALACGPIWLIARLLSRR